MCAELKRTKKKGGSFGVKRLTDKWRDQIKTLLPLSRLLKHCTKAVYFSLVIVFFVDDSFRGYVAIGSRHGVCELFYHELDNFFIEKRNQDLGEE